MASSSRKRLTRRLNSDEIEDSRPSQPNGQKDDDVSDDERSRPSRRAKEVKKEKKAKKEAVQSDEEDAQVSDDDEEDEDDRIDVENFPDQPIRQEQLAKLNNFADDWSNFEMKLKRQASVHEDVAVAVAELGDVLGDSGDINAVTKDFTEFLDTANEMAIHGDSLRALYQKGFRGEPVVDPRKMYEDLVEEKMEEYAGKTTRQKYMDDKLFKNLQEHIWEVQHPSEPMPPLTDLIPKEDGDLDDDDDLEMGGVTQQYTCPLTLTILVKPVTSDICNHSFSEAPIIDYFKGMGRGVKKCPASGCNKQFALSNCKRNETLEKRVNAHQRRIARAEEHSDAEEVID